MYDIIVPFIDSIFYETFFARACGYTGIIVLVFLEGFYFGLSFMLDSCSKPKYIYFSHLENKRELIQYNTTQLQ